MRRLLSCLALISIGSPVWAATDCDIYDSLVSAHRQTTLILESNDTLMQQGTLPLLQAKITYLRSASVTRLLPQELGADDLRIAIDLLLLMAEIAESDADALAFLSFPLNRAPHMALLADSKPIVDGLLCTSPAVASSEANTVTASMDGTVAAPATQLGPIRKFDFITSFLFVDALLAIGLAIWAGRKLWAYYRQSRQRKAKRYPVNLKVQFATGAHNHIGWLRDISRIGVGLTHAGEISEGSKANIKLFIEGRWVEGKIMRATDTFCGVEFEQKMTRAEVSAIRSAERRLTKNKKQPRQEESYEPQLET